MRQLIIGQTPNGIGNPASFPCYAALRGAEWEQGGYTNEKFQYSHPWSVAGHFKNLYVEIEHLPENPSQNGWPDLTFTIYVNDVATPLSVTVPSAPAGGDPTVRIYRTAINTSGVAAISPGDRVAIGRGPGSIAPGLNQFTVWMAWSLTFESTNAGESSYGTSSYGTGVLNATNRLFTAPFNGHGGFEVGTDAITEPTLHSIVPLDGSLFRLDVQLDIAPGGGLTRTFAAMLNGVLQDGSGGTVDTRVALSNSTKVAHATFNLPIHVLDWLSIVQLVSSGSPAASLLTCSVGVRANTDGQSALNFDSAGSNPSNTAGLVDFASGINAGWAQTTARAPTPSTQASRWPMTEESMSMPGPIDTYSLQNLCVNLSAAPTTGTYNFTTRKGLASTPAVLSMSGSDILKVGTGESGSYSSPTDRMDLQSIAASAPNAARIAWTWLIATLPGEGGLYFIDPGKTNDTLYTAITSGGTSSPPTFTTVVVAIPNPFIVL